MFCDAYIVERRREELLTPPFSWHPRADAACGSGARKKRRATEVARSARRPHRRINAPLAKPKAGRHACAAVLSRRTAKIAGPSAQRGQDGRAIPVGACRRQRALICNRAQFRGRRGGGQSLRKGYGRTRVRPSGEGFPLNRTDQASGCPRSTTLASLIHDARFRVRSGHLLRLAVLRGRPASLAFVSPHSD